MYYTSVSQDTIPYIHLSNTPAFIETYQLMWFLEFHFLVQLP